MTGRITSGFFKSDMATAGPDDAAVRISKRTGEATTAPHGFFSRAVRWLFGPTKKDIAANEEAVNGFSKFLTKSFGPEIAKAALLHVRKDAAATTDGFTYDAAKPLTVRQIKDARTFAQAAADGAQHGQLMRAMAAAVLRHGPGGPKFAAAAEAKGVDASRLGDEQRLFVLTRLEEDVQRLTREHNRLPEGKEIASLAGKLARQAEAMGPEGAAEANARIEAARATARDALAAIVDGADGKGKNPVELLGRLLEQGDGLVRTMSLDEGEIGTDDRNKAALGAISEAVSRLRPEEARDVFAAMTAADSPTRKLLAAFLKSEDKVSGHDGARLGAVGQLQQVIDAAVAGVGRRAGDPDTGKKVSAMTREVGRDRDLAEDRDVQHLSGAFDHLIDARGAKIAEWARIAEEEDRAQREAQERSGVQ